MRAADIIIKKRGFKTICPAELSKEEIEFMLSGYIKGEIPEYQISAWLMAIYFNGMSFKETAALTQVMLHSGEVMDLSGAGNFFVDKHSTGGVGDKISLPLAPIAAANGVKVPMMSGRALGHTGGTLDKLESVTGYRTNISSGEFKNFISEIGFAMTGQTEKIVPADKLLYALRDVTGCVESVPLITSSILSKKIAEGSDALVFDVKCGSGAFMKNFEEAETLAVSLVETAKAMGKKALALITNMNEPLGLKVGNFLEVEESMDILEGKGPEDTSRLTLELAARMIVFAGAAENIEKGFEAAKKVIASGKAMELFLKNIEMQGGDVKKLLRDRNKRRSIYKTEIFAARGGYINSIDAFKLGSAGILLGVGRSTTKDSVCAEAGMEILKPSGSAVKKGEPIMIIYAKDEASLIPACELINKSVIYSDDKPAEKKLILKEII